MHHYLGTIKSSLETDIPSILHENCNGVLKKWQFKILIQLFVTLELILASKRVVSTFPSPFLS